MISATKRDRGAQRRPDLHSHSLLAHTYWPPGSGGSVGGIAGPAGTEGVSPLDLLASGSGGSVGRSLDADGIAGAPVPLTAGRYGVGSGTVARPVGRK